MEGGGLDGTDPGTASDRFGQRPQLAAPAARFRWLPVGEHALHPLLIALLLLILVAKPLLDLGYLPARAMGVSMLLVMLSGLTLLDRGARLGRLVMFGVIATTTVLHLMALGAPRSARGILAEVSGIAALLVLFVAVLRQSLAPGRVTMRRIEGAVAAYLLLGLLFASAYDLVDAVSPGAFERHGMPLDADSLKGDFLFFSFVTLTTTGYGDIVPVHPAARALVLMQVISGTIFVTVLLARLVSLELADRGRGQDGNP